jgi:flagellar biosynthetic protein FliQ
MSQELIVGLATEAINVLLLVAAPLLLAGLVVGVLISIFQTATSIQDQTLTFIPKIITVLLMLLFSLPWIMRIMTDYVTRLFGQLDLYIR